MTRRRFSTAVLAALAGARAHASQAARNDNSGNNELNGRIHQKVDGFAGKVSLYARNFKTGQSYGLREDEPVRTASTIKLAILVECFFEAAEGRLDLKEPAILTSAEKVTGSGLLQEFSDGDKLPFRDVMDLMIVMSDNTATNLILDRIGGDAVNARMAKLGLTQTRVMRKILLGSKTQSSGVTEEGRKPENAKWGIGRSSPKEMVEILEKIYRGEVVNKAASDDMLAVLKRQRDHNGLGRDMRDVAVASKSGALDQLRSDVGILYAPNGPFAMAVTVDDMPEVNWTPDNPGSLLISALSELVVAGLQ
jgi:beta-lactamase class A